MAHLKPWRLPAGMASVRGARRNAFSLLHSCELLDHPGARMLVEGLSEAERAVTATMIERGLNSPLTSSMGRLLDAMAAMLGICLNATYEGEPASCSKPRRGERLVQMTRGAPTIGGWLRLSL